MSFEFELVYWNDISSPRITKVLKVKGSHSIRDVRDLVHQQAPELRPDSLRFWKLKPAVTLDDFVHFGVEHFSIGDFQELLLHKKVSDFWEDGAVNGFMHLIVRITDKPLHYCIDWPGERVMPRAWLSVTTQDQDSMDTVTNKIYSAQKNQLQILPINSLSILAFKLGDENCVSLADFKSYVSNGFRDGDLTELAFSNKISDIWPDGLPDNRVHVVVRVLATGPSMSISFSKSSNLITPQDNEYLASRGNATYQKWWGKPLNMSTELLPEEPGDPDEMNIDTAPISADYLDLENPLIQSIGKILLRKEYTAAMTYLKKSSTTNPTNAVIIMGSPGVGKTCGLWAIFRERCKDEKPTLFQMGRVGPIFFCERGVFVGEHDIEVAMAACKKGTICSLFDTRGTGKMAKPIMWDTDTVFAVQTSSPNKEIFDKWFKQRSGAIWIMKPWDWEEFRSGIKLQPSFKGPVNFDLLRRAIAKYGPIPRNVYLAYSQEGSISHLDLSVKAEVQQMTLLTLQKLMTEVQTSEPSGFSHKIIATSRNERDEPFGFIISSYVTQLLMLASTFKTLAEKRQLYQFLVGVPPADGALGHGFESYAHGVLVDIANSGKPHTIIKLSKSSKQSTKYQECKTTSTIHYPNSPYEACVYESAADFQNSPAKNDTYYIPLVSNNPGFDSFIIIGGHVWTFQMTISASHAIDTPTEKGRKLLLKILAGRRQLQWHYVLVVPMHTKNPSLTGVTKSWKDAVNSSFHVMKLNMSVVNRS